METFRHEAGVSYWNSKLLISGSHLAEQNFILAVLNHGLDNLKSAELDHFRHLWRSAKFRLAVDGGANKLLELGPSFIPDYISGDFDSIKESTLKHFENQGVTIVPTIDQDNTDFYKALLIIDEKCERSECPVDFVVTLWQRTSRLDQTFGVISALHKLQAKNDFRPVFLFDLTGSLSWLLLTGRHEITSNPSKWCSVVPFDGPSTVTSTGLLYDMDKLTLSYSTIISTSNSFEPKVDKVALLVEGNPVLWSQEAVRDS